jgi:thiaminase/transcriptional activator TenA
VIAPLRAARWLEQCPADWQAATHHPFLDGVRDGSLDPAAFGRWLVQDHLFVDDLLRAQARLLAQAPRADQAVLIGGLAALEAELGWFETHAARLGLTLAGERHAVTQRYQQALGTLQSPPYLFGITALWTLERAYLEAWQGAAPGAPAYAEFVEHWTVPAFADYVAGLERAVDAALSTAGEEEQVQARAVFRGIAHLEAEFWAIASP